MAETVSEAFRENCYDLSKKQRLVLRSGNLTLSNEDIGVNGAVKFNLASITSTQQVQFGCTPCNTVGVTILNEDGRIKADSIVASEFKCEIGVEMESGEYAAPKNAITAVNTNYDYISIHSESPYIRGNCTFASVLPQLMSGYKCKILYSYDVLYFVVDNEGTKYYAKYTKTGEHSYGEYSTPSDTECEVLDKLMDENPCDAIAFFDGGMREYTYMQEYVIPGEWHNVAGSIIHVTDALAYRIKSWVVGLGMSVSASADTPTSDFITWNEMNDMTWGTALNRTWGELSGYSIFSVVSYESVPYGVWHFDRPRKVNSAVLTLNGKDRMTLFDEDSLNFVSSMVNTSLTVRNAIVAIANYKNVPVGDLSGLNELADEIVVDLTQYYQSKSLKDLLSYLFEVGGANAIIDRRGRLSASNTIDEPVELPYVYTFDVADYTAHTIGKMLVYKQGEYTQYEEDDTVENGETYDWNDNPFFNNMVLTGSWFSEDVHKKYGGFRNAITVTEADYSLWCDDVYSWEDEDETVHREPIFTMSVEWNGSGRVSYANYGEETRQYSSYNSRIQGVSSINDTNLQGFNKAQRANKLYFDENGLTVDSNGLRILNENGEAVLSADDDGNLTLKGDIKSDGGNIGNWDITHNGLRYTGYAGDGTTGIISLEPHLGQMEIQAIGEDKTRVGIGYDHVIFEECDGEGNVVQTVSGIIQFNTDTTQNTLWVGKRAYSETKTYRIQLVGDKIYIYSANLELASLPTSVSSANMVVVSGRVYQVSSLLKYKDNVKTIENAWETVDNLRGVSFTSKCEGDDPEQVIFGLIAEEVEKACPELASYTNGELQGVQYDRVCALLIEDLKACHKRIEELEAKIADIEKRLK